jgi:hypothetical protein
MNRNKVRLTIFTALVAVLMMSCGRLLPTPETSVDALYTQAAQTIQAQLTEQAAGTQIALPTQTGTPQGIPPTITSQPVVPTVVVPTQVILPSATQTLLPTPTSLPPTPTPIQVLCDHASFVKDVTVADGTNYPPGAEFTKIWRLRNVGSCSWDSDYSLVFVSGDRMSAPKAASLEDTVRPGENVDLAVDMMAPGDQGRYRGFWMLENPEGETFGINEDADDPFWVDIRVQAPNKNFALDLATNMCTATWRSSAGPLGCPGDPDDEDGSVSLLNDPRLENGRRENEPTLLTRPEETHDGWIQGVYPSYKVKAGDHFLADIGCLEDSQGCEVLFTLEYQVSGGPVKQLGEWYEIYDGSITRVDVDLSGLEGKTIQLILSATGYGKPSRANPFWLAPSVRQYGPTPVPPTPVVYAPAIEAARHRVAQDTGKNPSEVVVVSFMLMEWEDTCLGVHLPDQICAEAIIPGYKVNMVAGNDYYEAHTNMDGSVIYWFEL